MPISEERSLILERKIDDLTTAVNRLILIDERQITQGKRLGDLEERCGNLE